MWELREGKQWTHYGWNNDTFRFPGWKAFLLCFLRNVPFAFCDQKQRLLSTFLFLFNDISAHFIRRPFQKLQQGLKVRMKLLIIAHFFLGFIRSWQQQDLISHQEQILTIVISRDDSISSGEKWWAALLNLCILLWTKSAWNSVFRGCNFRKFNLHRTAAVVE